MVLPDNLILVQKDVKHARIRVSEDGKIRAIIPETFSEDDITALLKKKKSWIEKHLRFFNGMSKIILQRNELLLFGNRYSYFYDSTYEHKVLVDHEHKTINSRRNLLEAKTQQAWYTNLARKYLTKRTSELAGNLHFEYNKLYIRNQRTKWGNCSKEKNISLNWRLIKAPLFVIDYLIIHELLHTVVMNHSQKFWTMLKSYYPDYKDAISWLDKFGNSL
ncbi:M48 family metallopeptidase [Mucilaginibacter rigui]|uniref:M48 family metallopeptidase n=1 Tax=Mucilaginibacter rigui TaxID=534635 RepID=A0ABR7X255_9SPHI|nr:SprT family zinc-dependent metalloprotease [Mucilaginibacter rigui]MBD1384601.1 M48 family metallopeptidase [Mucilaginibacter rigui]